MDALRNAISTKRPVVLIVNPNTNASTTAMMTELAAAELSAGGLQVVGRTAVHGPRMLIDPDSLEASVEHVRDAVRSYLDGRDGSKVVAVIVAAVGDPGLRELSNELEIPVVGIGEASIWAASKNGRPFGMATSTPLLVRSLTALVFEHGRDSLFCGVKLTASGPLVLAADPEKQFRELRDAVLASVADGAQAVVIAGGPLSETARRLTAEHVAVIVEPIPSACQLVLERLAPG